MAMVAICESDDGLDWRRKSQWTPNSRIYTHRKLNRALKVTTTIHDGDASTASPAAAGARSGSADAIAPIGVAQEPAVAARPAEKLESFPLKESPREEEHSPSPSCSLVDGNLDSLVRDDDLTTNPEQRRVPDFILGDVHEADKPENVDNLRRNSPSRRRVEVEDLRVASELSCDDEEEPVRAPDGLPSGGVGPVEPIGALKPLVISQVGERVRLRLSKDMPRKELKDLRIMLKFQLDQIRNLMKRVEASELQATTHSYRNFSNFSNVDGGEDGNVGVHNHHRPDYAGTNFIDRRTNLETRHLGLLPVNSNMSVGRNCVKRSLKRQLSVSTWVSNHGSGDYVEKEKIKPKANQYYRDSEFLLRNDRLPPKSAKRMKTSNARNKSKQVTVFGFESKKGRNQLYKSCISLLQRLMKHKHGWVFNEPVNAEVTGAFDYHRIIKHPMDLGTVKARLSQLLYETPAQFAEDVRLVFRNAMTYNPVGHEVHAMAEELSLIFEQRWAVAESEFNSCLDGAASSLRLKEAPPLIAAPCLAAAKANVVRRRVIKKPQAKDPNKRDMTREEKRKLSAELEKLPPEKLDAIVRIVKKRSNGISHYDDKIEVDLDRVDAETLWELDRLVSNYKKYLSKKKRRAELASSAAEKNTIDAAKTIEVEGENKGISNGDSRSSSESDSSGSSSSSDSDSDSDSSSSN